MPSRAGLAKPGGDFNFAEVGQTAKRMVYACPKCWIIEGYA